METDWGFCRIGRSLARRSMRTGTVVGWFGQRSLVLALLVAALASWWLSGWRFAALLAATGSRKQFHRRWAAHGKLRAPLNQPAGRGGRHRSQPVS